MGELLTVLPIVEGVISKWSTDREVHKGAAVFTKLTAFSEIPLPEPPLDFSAVIKTQSKMDSGAFGMMDIATSVYRVALACPYQPISVLFDCKASIGTFCLTDASEVFSRGINQF